MDHSVTGEWSMSFTMTPRVIGLIRRQSARALDRLGWPGDRDAALLVVSELTTNAVVHAAVPGRLLRLRLAALADGRLLVDVSDPVARMPDHGEQNTEPDEEGGRGLLLVRCFARLSWRPDGNGKTVRALLST
ncbi:ATP-binding protein [Streptomyces sp. NPDC127068]|uniref:ATP-binding protein n=1 Tax=Streptomyces sp. NPDC127068 TaxID=3347127 RepID=UPI00364E9D83